MNKDKFPFSQRIQRLLSTQCLLLLAVTALAALLRLYALQRLPPGLYHDEAYNGLDALDVLQGVRPIFFEANNGREPLFIYLVALSVSFLGRSPLAIRLVAALLGVLTVPAAYLMARELLGQREALFTALVTAIAFWHLNLSRVGFRAVSLPLLAAVCLWLFACGLHRRRWYYFVLCGFFLGLSFYTYLAARFLLIFFLLLIAYLIWRRQTIEPSRLLLLGAIVFVTALPLLLYALRHLDTFLVRSAQVSIFNPAINQGDVIGTLLHHLGKTLGMFNWRGDFIPRHNMPYRPVFDPPMGALFLLGLVISLARARQHQEYAFLSIYCFIMLTPTILAEDAPHFLRAVGVLPVLFAFPAIGLNWTWEAVQARTSRGAASLLAALLIGISLYATVHDYFLCYVRSETVYYHFETGAVELAAEINRFTGIGWCYESGLRVPSSPALPQRRVYLDSRLWRDWTSLRYLVPESTSVILFGSNTTQWPPVEDAWLVVWPYTEYYSYLSLLPAGSLISVREGPWERGDLEQEARLLCIIYEAEPASRVPANLRAHFEQGVELLGYELRRESEGINLRLFWRTEATLNMDYTVFVHLKQGEQIVAQSDSYPAQGYYPTHLWRPGDVIADDHLLTIPPSKVRDCTFAVGLYDLRTMVNLQVLDENGQPYANAVTIPLP
ncbi:MAG: ArnT family glycosyltransferase [Anaerolineae bacterium]